nr:uncharacterized protein LOC100178629 isoform X2 [Ciona intestinalis]|eukprot:XP_002127193.3 uncharacterized protein LOC100178629 isoform X2 [Ciona intestinalis]
MSESSFDTSAAETAQSFTSGLSLGQCIKKTEEESKPTKWYELQPTFENQWHTLQGEPVGSSAQASLYEDITQVPITEDSIQTHNKSISQKEEQDPISRLLQSTTTPLEELKKTYHDNILPNSSSFYTAGTNVQDPYTSTYSGKPKVAWSTKPDEATTAADTADNQSLSDTLSVEMITNILEKDDSLAQRVRELLEDEKSSEQSEPDLLKEQSTTNRFPELLQTETPTSVKQYQDQTTKTTETEITKTSVASSSPSSSIPSFKESKDFPTSKPVHTIDNKADTPSIPQPQSTSITRSDRLSFDPLFSLNSTRSTEYGDLPDAVDIPQDIVDRINSLRMSQREENALSIASIIETQPKYAWSDTKQAINHVPSSAPQTSVVVSKYTSLNKQTSNTNQDQPTQLSGGIPIAGDVQYHTGSNPITPQFPVEEDKLLQLHTYITKKTGFSSISPLVSGNARLPSPPDYSSVTNDAEDLPVVSSSSSSLPVSHPITVDVAHDVEDPVDVIGSERKEPEGMSPPITTAAPLSTLSKPIPDNNLYRNLNVPNNFFPQSGIKNPDKSFADESLLAKIKSVLSDSMMSQMDESQDPNILVSGGERSINSSIDSLAVQVKALLEEEIPLALNGSGNEMDQSNLSEAIENFENTEIWKYVMQFLPTVESGRDMVDGNRNEAYSNKQETTGNGSLDDSAIGNSFLERVRFEYRKEKVLQEKQRILNDPDVTAETRIRRDDIKVQDISSHTSKSNAHTPTMGNYKPTQPPYDPHQTKESSKFDESNISIPTSTPDEELSFHRITESHSTPDPNSSHPPTSFQRYESIPGIPSFKRSVLSPSVSTNSSSSSTPRPQEHLEKPKEQVKPVSFTPYKSNATNVISNQISRANQRNFNYTMTPAKPLPVPDLQPTDSVKQNKEASFDHLRVSSFVSEISQKSEPNIRAKESYQPKQEPPSPYIRSAYFDTKPTYNTASNPTKGSHHTHRNDFTHQKEVTPQPSSKNTRGSPKQSSSRVRNGRETQHTTYRSPPRNSGEKFPQREKLKSSVKYLPTFAELMKQQEREENKSHHQDLDVIPTNDRKPPLRPVDVNKEDKLVLGSLPKITVKTPVVDVRLKKDSSEESVVTTDKSIRNLEISSCRPEIPSDDSYQDASLTNGDGNLSSGKTGSTSDLDIQRRIVNHGALEEDRNTSRRKSQSKMPLTLQEFQQLGEDSQRRLVNRFLPGLKEKKNTSRGGRSHHSAPASGPKSSAEPTTDDFTTNAVCDSDSTEYCDLPDSRPASSLPKDSTVERLLGVDESRAEIIMRRLMDKIERQKVKEGSPRLRHARSPASSSTPQRVHAAIIPPEASSIASTDTDARSVHFVKVRDKKHVGHKKKKVTYVEEVSSSEPTVIHVKRRHRKHEEKIPQRLVLHDRSIQTFSPTHHHPVVRISMKNDAGTNIPSPTRRNKTPRKSRAVQTTTAEQESLNDTITYEPVEEDKENNVVSDPKEKSRFSSFYVDFDSKSKKPTTATKQANAVMPKSVAWYEPYRYEPPWGKPHTINEEPERPGLVRQSLQDALVSHHPQFVTKSRQRQRKIAISSEERAMQEIWAEERERVFGKKKDITEKRRTTTPVPVRRRVEMTRKQIIAETREKYKQLPEVVNRKKEEERKREYSTNRHKALMYKKKVQNQVLGRCFNN